MVLFFCLTTLQNWQNCPAALTNHSGFLSIQLGFFRTSRGGANTQSLYAAHHSFILCFVSYRNMAPIVNSDGTVMQQQFLIIPTTIKIPRLSFNVIKTI